MGAACTFVAAQLRTKEDNHIVELAVAGGAAMIVNEQRSRFPRRGASIPAGSNWLRRGNWWRDTDEHAHDSHSRSEARSSSPLADSLGVSMNSADRRTGDGRASSTRTRSSASVLWRAKARRVEASCLLDKLDGISRAGNIRLPLR